MRATIKANNFDSTLKGDVLTLSVRVLITQTPPGQRANAHPPNFSAPRRPTRAWPDKEWATWPSRWRALILSGWDDKFVLHSSDHTPNAVDRHVRCRLELFVAGVDPEYKDPPHLRMLVDYKSGIRSGTARGGDKNPAHVDAVLESGDLDEKLMSLVASQRSALHEFGHYLDLKHRCEGHGEGYCTLGDGLELVQDVMGQGDQLHPWHAAAWLLRLREHEYYPGANWTAEVKATGETAAANGPPPPP
jgi:hypothetical protein